MARPTYEQLVGAVLGLEDVGAPFECSGEPLRFGDAPANVMRGFTRRSPDRVVLEEVMVTLLDAVSGTPRQYVEGVLRWTRGFQRADDPDRIDVVHLAPPPFGEEGVRYQWRHAASSEKKNGDHIAWRYENVIACVAMLGRGQPDALPYAELQHAKLVAVLIGATAPAEDDTPVEPLVVVRTECPPSHPIKATRGPGGERLYYKPLDCAYEEVIGEACFVSEAAAQRAGYRYARSLPQENSTGNSARQQ